MTPSSSYLRYALYGLAAFMMIRLFDTKGPDEDTMAAQFELPLVTTGARPEATVSLADRKGKPMLIEVFASWCGSCRRSAPTLARAHDDHGGEVEFLGVSVDERAVSAASAQKAWGIPYPVAHDADGSFARKYQISVLPTFILIDGAGRIREVSTGTPSRRDLDGWVEAVAR